MKRIEGECFCGEISYSFNPPVNPARCCHCSRCRKAFSGSGSAMSIVTDKEFKIDSGDEFLASYINMQGVGLSFCKKCGSTLFGLSNEKVFGITLGTLNNNPEVKIHDHIFVDSKACWDEISGNALQYDRYPQE